MANINDTIERKLLPLANKMSSWRYLKAIRDSFLTLLPISLTGGIASVLGAAPFPKEEAEGFLYLFVSVFRYWHYVFPVPTLQDQPLYAAVGEYRRLFDAGRRSSGTWLGGNDCRPELYRRQGPGSGDDRLDLYG